MEESEKKVVTLLALGGAGCRILNAISGDPALSGIRLAAADTDSESLKNSGAPEADRLLAGGVWRHGRGCGGNPIDGQRAFSHERGNLEKLLTGADFLFVIAGLGGGAASGGAPVVLSVARRMNLPVFFVVTMPFSLEGHTRRRTAEECVANELVGLADAVIPLPNDLLFSVLEPNTPLTEAYALSDVEAGRTVVAMARLLAAGNLMSADFADLSSVLRRRKCLCSVGVGVARREDGGAETGMQALEKMLASPLLGGAGKLRSADAVMFTLLGGPELSLGEAKQVFELAGRQVSPETSLVVGAAVHEAWRGMLQLSAVTVKYDIESAPGSDVAARSATRPAPVRRHKGAAVQEAAESGDLLQPSLFELFTRGIMEQTTRTTWRGEDLDVPAFRRRGMAIDTGETVSGK
ncbi:MAG: hypothetical protein PHI35_03540 [Victivallaceae bacterium]|nr:hypothetical protein [Victivallaceae bacterium]